MYQPRQLAPVLQQALSGFPAILITGPRQSGKTTFLKHEAGEQVDYVSFDDPLEREFALVDPTGFLGRLTSRLFWTRFSMCRTAVATQNAH